MPPTLPEQPSGEITTLTLFGLKPGNMRWGLAQMGTFPPQLRTVPGLLFFKMLGCGRGAAFSLWPDLHRYGLLCCWENEEAAHTFFEKNLPFQVYQNHAAETWTVWLKLLQSHGNWDGKIPFTNFINAPVKAETVAVLTRATVRLKALPSFWQHAALTTRAIQKANGLIASIGMGELPFIRQATFSIWENAAALQAYAYGNKEHKEVIRRTRQENWYSEELFARFVPLKAEGSWHGEDPLKG